ncbi:MAG: YihY family inner membrane protein [Sandaracinaceae bacterium]|nr:YihY family inner membrane protein [Sandaracinaceae bacterium]
MARDRPGAAERIRGRVHALRASLHRALWEIDEASLSPPRRVIVGVARLVFVTADTFLRERLQVRAAALAFFTVLSIVPAGAFVFSIAKALGAYDLLIEETVRPLIHESFPDPDAAGTPEGVVVLRTTLDRLIDLVANTDVFGLGLVGVVVLSFTIHRVLLHTEQSFDAIWGFEGRRNYVRRLPVYLVIVLFTPLGLVFASTITAARQGQPVMAALDAWLAVPLLVDLLVLALPPLLVWLALLPLYLLLPSARVRRRSAMLGALVGGLAWYGIQIAHVTFQIGVARQNALYSGFGAFPLFLVWLHLSWMCVLLGAQVAASHQNAPTLRQLARVNLADHLSVQAVALRAMTLLPDDPQGEALRALARDVGVAVEPLRSVLDMLVDAGLLTRRGGAYDPRYAAAIELDTVRVATVIDALGRRDATSGMPWSQAERAVTEVLEKLHGAVESSSHNRTIGELRRRGAPDDET